MLDAAAKKKVEHAEKICFFSRLPHYAAYALSSLGTNEKDADGQNLWTPALTLTDLSYFMTQYIRLLTLCSYVLGDSCILHEVKSLHVSISVKYNLYWGLDLMIVGCECVEISRECRSES